MKPIVRQTYLDFLYRHKDKPVIKVVTGIRRAGKSTLFALYKQELIEQGVKKEQIISINFEDLQYYELRDFLKLNDFIVSQLSDGQTYYIFLDEIQHVDKFELVADSLFIKDNVDLYITGSNAHFMRGDLATNLTGRYVEIEVLPLSFQEFYTWKKVQNEKQSDIEIFDEYKFSAFPYLIRTTSYAEKIDYISALYNSILVNDIFPRSSASSPELLQRIIRTLLSSIGSPISINKIKNTLNSQNITISNTTLEKYISAILDSYLFYSVPRYNVRGRALLQRLEKFYVADLGLRNYLLPDHHFDTGNLLENLVFLELKRRYKHVYVGNIDRSEVDFVTIDNKNALTYYQVAETTLASETLTRELRPLQKIQDQYPKYLLTMDEFNKEANYDGIQKKHILTWLLEKK